MATLRGDDTKVLALKTFRTALLALAMLTVLPVCVPAQTDEIQVYDAEINKPGEFNLVWYNNYTPIGRNEPDFPGGVIPNHSLIGVPEWAVGITDWLETGLYLPLYSITSGERFLFNGGKVRALFVVPDARKRNFIYGINFELSYNFPHWETTRFSGEIRPIIGTHLGKIDIILNPIFDTSFNGLHKVEVVPAARVAYNFSEKWAAALEHYSDFGTVSHFVRMDEQQQLSFIVGDFNEEPNSIEFGVGHGWTDSSDDLIIKVMLMHKF
ncbi:hypothetical protein [Geotalea sp. SG265]|uniref:hypothetical protein n=1 Tax=Geotalea sp. SG265 TaxID=2922867 RepID=UPI001FAFB7F2|nr:hypothetical protein [Geotalea sp. SG265]